MKWNKINAFSTQKRMRPHCLHWKYTIGQNEQIISIFIIICKLLFSSSIKKVWTKKVSTFIQGQKKIFLVHHFSSSFSHKKYLYHDAYCYQPKFWNIVACFFLLFPTPSLSPGSRSAVPPCPCPVVVAEERSSVWHVCWAASCQAPLLHYDNAVALVPASVLLTARSIAPVGQRMHNIEYAESKGM